VILALDGLQPEVGHEVLWVIGDCLSGEVLLARSLLSGTAGDLAPLLREVASAVGMAVAGVVSDGQTSIRRAVEQALPGVSHQLCQFHFLREAARLIFEADRHAKTVLKKQVRGVRPTERAEEGMGDPQAAVGQGYGATVRSHHRRWPSPAGCQRSEAQGAAGEGCGQSRTGGRKRDVAPPLAKLQQLIRKDLTQSATFWPDIERAYPWVHKAAHIPNNPDAEDAATAQRRFDGLVGAMVRHSDSACSLSDAVEHFGDVTRSYRPGLFRCYAVADLPHTNNDLKHGFGSQRYHERRATGRKTASPTVVLRAEARLTAAIATRHHPPSGADLAASIASNGTHSANASTTGAKPVSCAPAFAAIRMPTWQNWNKKPASKLCRPRKKDCDTVRRQSRLLPVSTKMPDSEPHRRSHRAGPPGYLTDLAHCQ